MCMALHSGVHIQFHSGRKHTILGNVAIKVPANVRRSGIKSTEWDLLMELFSDGCMF